MHRCLRRLAPAAVLAALVPSPSAASPPASANAPFTLNEIQVLINTSCTSLVRADVVALDQPWMWNRYGAIEPQGMIYALRRDVVSVDDPDGLPQPGDDLQPGKVRLRRDKRPRPLVLRVHAGGCLYIKFQNLLDPDRDRIDQKSPRTRAASIHVKGMQLFNLDHDGANVHTNREGVGVVDPGETTEYILYAEHEGTYLLHSMGAILGGEGDGGSISAGLFGAVNVEPAGSVWYRSQATRADLEHAASPGSLADWPKIDYAAKYRGGPYDGLPVLAILGDGNEIVHSDLTAIITGPGGGNLPLTATELYPRRFEPFREFTIIFHDEIGAVQAFPEFEDFQLQFTLHSVRDAFAINYGTGGIGAEILANRFRVGPVHDCVECKYEEFFLSSWAVGDPAMVVDVPANYPCLGRTESPNADPGDDYEKQVDSLRRGRDCRPEPGPKATRAFFPDDPSNVYHSYLHDKVRFRNLHAGSDDHHIFHLHAHQWLHTPNDSLSSSYLDSQAIGQGASYTYEIARGGSGNLNQTVGDSIFHCHFYPHFAQGMWSLWRVHDVLEVGTEMGDDGRPREGARALPDGEIAAGTPIPAVVPIPGLPMAPPPWPVSIRDGQAVIDYSDERRLREYLADGSGRWHPGYPFFVPGAAGHRPPTPPMDVIDDGGLQRHRVRGGVAKSEESRLSFAKVLHQLQVDWLEEEGTRIEKLAMDFHADADGHNTRTPAGEAGRFPVNGRQPVAGAPFADPCLGSGRKPDRLFKAADIQIDAVLNRAGWHFPQQRITTLWEDVRPTLADERAPEPFFIRAASGECIEFQLTNLAPNEYQLDDFQVRTPTDILGQHIHLVKFDVLASDGGANGFNYEDGTMSPEEVQERICAIRQARPDRCGEPLGHCEFRGTASRECPLPEAHPFFGTGHDADCDGHDDWLGAQTTVQRWYADPLPGPNNSQRTLRTVFTHDHFGPSTHQQAGLYGGLIVEEPGTQWLHNETGEPLGGRHDGGPTSWQAAILSPDERKEFREFLLEFADFQLAYEPPRRDCPDPRWGWADPARAINPPGRKLERLDILFEKPEVCPVNLDDYEYNPLDRRFAAPSPPCPEAVSADDPGTTSVNYRSEPLALRVRDPDSNRQAPHAPGEPGDLSFAYETRTDRLDWRFNTLPSSAGLPELVPYGPLTRDLHEGDPFTPVLRSYEGDRVVVRTLVGAHEEEHNFSIHGMKWLAEPHRADSGYRTSQNTMISEWFDFVVPRVPSLKAGEEADLLYLPTSAAEWQWNGAWGLVRVYRDERPQKDLVVLPRQNPDARAVEGTAVLAEVPETEVGAQDSDISSSGAASEAGSEAPGEAGPEAPAETGPEAPEETGERRTLIPCPRSSYAERRRIYDITAVAASEALRDDGGTLIYNGRSASLSNGQSGPLHDPTAILFVHTEDLEWVTPPGGATPRPRLRPGVRREPLVLRASAGECIQVTLRNEIPRDYEDLDGWSALPMIVEEFNANQVAPSLEVGLHPQLVYYDILNSGGVNVGINRRFRGIKQTVAPGERIKYFWYAGDYNPETTVATPIEFGSTGLSSSDPIQHANKGAVGALIVEPLGAEWREDTIDGQLSRASATVTHTFGRERASFREFVLVFQDNLNLRYKSGEPIKSLEVNEDATESGQKAINYRTEPIWYRLGHPPETPMDETNEIDSFHRVLLKEFVGAPPETPTFTAKAGERVRFRLIHPGGHTQAHVFDLHGHVWQEQPYGKNSEILGANRASEWQGAKGGHGPTSHFDVLLDKAGGKFSVFGDYLYRDYPPWLLDDGIWGILQVVEP